jgi:hypothetical protein
VFRADNYPLLLTITGKHIVVFEYFVMMDADKEEGVAGVVPTQENSSLRASPTPTQEEQPVCKKYTAVQSVGISHDRNARFRRSMEVCVNMCC